MRLLSTMTRSQLARHAGVNPETVRYYEQRGLIPTPPRSAGGYRQYDRAYIERIRFIQRAQALGFTLQEIQELLLLRISEEADKRMVRVTAQTKLEEVDQKITDLMRIRAALSHLVTLCSGHGATGDCPILEALSDDEALLHAFETHHQTPVSHHENH